MSFDSRFDTRWNQVIIPAIQAVRINDVPLQPHRVDARRISDSILTEILGGITNDRVIFADVTSLRQLDSRPMRNGNVMYEIGLAHAVRLPEEVILFRSDTDFLLFDVANVRVNTYSPDQDPDDARTRVTEAIVEAVREVDLKRQLTVNAAAETLDFPCWSVLLQTLASGDIQHFPLRTMNQALGNAANNAAIVRLLELGAIPTDYTKLTTEALKRDPHGTCAHLLRYRLTPFGIAIVKCIGEQMGYPTLRYRCW